MLRNSKSCLDVLGIEFNPNPGNTSRISGVAVN